MVRVGPVRFLCYLGLIFLIVRTALWDPSQTLYRYACVHQACIKLCSRCVQTRSKHCLLGGLFFFLASQASWAVWWLWLHHSGGWHCRLCAGQSTHWEPQHHRAPHWSRGEGCQPQYSHPPRFPPAPTWPHSGLAVHHNTSKRCLCFTEGSKICVAEG